VQITPNKNLELCILRFLVDEYRTEKPFPHLTELIYCLTRSYLDRKEPMPPTEREILLFALGFGLEKLLLKQLRTHILGNVDGVHYEMDFLSFTGIPGELKTTRASSKKFAEEEGFFPETWKRQILGYMYCQNILKYELIVLFLMGDYKPPFPQLACYTIEASTEELEKNWQWILERKTILSNAIEKSILPPPVFHFDWECKECRYSIRCEVARMEMEE